MAVATLKYQVLQTLQNKDKCSCQFTQNIKSQTSEGHLTDFDNLRNGCNSGSEVIVENEKSLGSGVSVGLPKVSDISPIPGSSDEYSGKLIVPLKGNLVRTLPSIEIPMYFASDSSGQIKECGANESHTAEIREERRQLMADLDTQDQEIKDLTETFNTHKHPHTHTYHRHFTPPPPILASNNGGGGSTTTSTPTTTTSTPTTTTSTPTTTTSTPTTTTSTPTTTTSTPTTTTTTPSDNCYKYPWRCGRSYGR